MPINPLTGMEEDENVPTQTPTPMPEQFANLKPPPVVFPKSTPAVPADAPMENQETISQPDQVRFAPVEQTETTTSSRKTVQTQNEKNLLKEADALVTSQIANEQKKAAIDVQLAEIESIKAQESADRIANREQNIVNVLKEADEELARRTAERDLQYENFKKMEFKDYWADRSSGSKIIAAIAVGLGGLGSGLTGSQGNGALEIINGAIAKDFEKQKQQIDKQKTVFNMSESLRDSSVQDRKKRLEELQLKEAAAYEGAAAKYAAMAAKAGVPQAQIASDATVLGLQQKALEKKIGVEKELRDEITTNTRRKIELQPVDANGNPVVPEKPLTEGQGNAVAFAKRMAEGVKNYDKVGGMSPAGADKVRKSIKANAFLDKNSGLYFLGAGAFNVPDLSEKDRLALQGMREVITAGLRKDSGAAIGLSEFEGEFDQLVPRAGDTPAVIKQKRGTVTNRIAAIMEQAGPGRNRIVAPAEPQQQAAEVRVINGTKYRKVPGGWEAMQ